MRYLAMILCCLAGPALADSGAREPWLAEPEDLALLRGCLANTAVQTSASCRFQISGPCLEEADAAAPEIRVELMAGCHDREAAAWGRVLDEDAWPRAVSAASERDAREDRARQLHPLMEDRLRAAQDAWNAHWRAACSYAYADGVLSGLPRVEASACISQMIAERVIFLNGVWDGT